MVGIKLDDSAFTYGGPPTQVTGDYAIQSSPTATGAPAAMTLDATLDLTGPTVDGAMRGVKFINLGFIQNCKFTKLDSVFSDGSGEKSNLQDGLYHIDTDPGMSPWYENRPGYGAFWSTTKDPKSTVTVNLTMNDTPLLAGTDTWGIIHSLTLENIHFDVLDWICATTTQSVNGSQNEYDAVAQGSWYFDGSGTFNGKVWTPFTWAGDGGDSMMSSTVTIQPITTGTSCNELLAKESFS